jgi:hypothetical protein
MVKAVKGYMTEDGRFFDSPQEAEMNEAEEVLRRQLEVSAIAIDVNDFLAIVSYNAPAIQRYITAILGIPINGEDSENFRLKRAEEEIIEAIEHTEAKRSAEGPERQQSPERQQPVATKATIKNELPIGTPLSRKHRSTIKPLPVKTSSI